MAATTSSTGQMSRLQQTTERLRHETSQLRERLRGERDAVRALRAQHAAELRAERTAARRKRVELQAQLQEVNKTKNTLTSTSSTCEQCSKNRALHEAEIRKLNADFKKKEQQLKGQLNEKSTNTSLVVASSCEQCATTKALHEADVRKLTSDFKKKEQQLKGQLNDKVAPNVISASAYIASCEQCAKFKAMHDAEFRRINVEFKKKEHQLKCQLNELRKNASVDGGIQSCHSQRLTADLTKQKEVIKDLEERLQKAIDADRLKAADLRAQHEQHVVELSRITRANRHDAHKLLEELKTKDRIIAQLRRSAGKVRTKGEDAGNEHSQMRKLREEVRKNEQPALLPPACDPKPETVTHHDKFRQNEVELNVSIKQRDQMVCGAANEELIEHPETDTDSAVSSAPSSLSPQPCSPAAAVLRDHATPPPTSLSPQPSEGYTTPPPGLWPDLESYDDDEGVNSELAMAKRQVRELERALLVTRATKSSSRHVTALSERVRQLEDREAELLRELGDLREQNELLEFRVLELAECPDKSSFSTSNWGVSEHSDVATATDDIPELLNDEPVRTRIADICSKTDNTEDKKCLLQVLMLLHGLDELSKRTEIYDSDAAMQIYNEREVTPPVSLMSVRGARDRTGPDRDRLIAKVPPFTGRTAESDDDRESPLRSHESSTPPTLVNSRGTQTDVTEGTTEEDSTKSLNLTTEVRKLDKLRETIDRNGRLVVSGSGCAGGCEQKYLRQLEFYRERVDVLERKVCVYESSGELQARQLAERLSREVRLEAQVKQLTSVLNKLQSENSRLEEERCELEEAENDTRLRCQRLETDILQLERSRMAAKRRSRENRQQAAYWEAMVSKYEERNYELEERECELRHRLEVMEKTAPAILLFNMWKMLKDDPKLDVASATINRLKKVGSRGRSSSIPRAKSRSPQRKATDIACSCGRGGIDENVEEKIRDLEGQRNNLIQAKQDMERKVHVLESQLNDLKHSTTNTSPSSSSAPYSGPSATSLMSGDYELITAVQELKERENDMRKRIDELEKREAAYMETLQQADEIWAEMECGYKKRISEAEQSEANMRDRLRRLEKREPVNYDELDHAERELAAQTQRLSRDNIRLQTEKKRLENELQCLCHMRDEKIRELETRMDRFRGELEYERRRSQELEQRLSDGEAALAELSRTHFAELETLRERLARTSNELVHLEVTNGELREEVETLEGKIAEVERGACKRAATDEQVIRGLSQELNDRDRELADMKQQDLASRAGERLGTALQGVKTCDVCSHTVSPNLVQAMEGVRTLCSLISHPPSRPPDDTQVRNRSAHRNIVVAGICKDKYLMVCENLILEQNCASKKAAHRNKEEVCTPNTSELKKSESIKTPSGPSSKASSVSKLSSVDLESSEPVSRKTSKTVSSATSDEAEDVSRSKNSSKSPSRKSSLKSAKVCLKNESSLTNEKKSFTDMKSQNIPAQVATSPGNSSKFISATNSLKTVELCSIEAKLPSTRESTITSSRPTCMNSSKEIILADDQSVDQYDLQTEVIVAGQPKYSSIQARVDMDTDHEIDGVTVMASVTESGNLELKTESPPGLIEHTMKYTPSGNMEITTGFVPDAAKELDAVPSYFYLEEEPLPPDIKSSQKVLSVDESSATLPGAGNPGADVKIYEKISATHETTYIEEKVSTHQDTISAEPGVISEESKKPVVVTPATEPGIRAVIFKDNGKPELYSSIISNEKLHAPRMIENSQSESDQMSQTVQVQVPHQTVLEEPMLYQNAQQPNINQYKKQDSKKSQSESDQMSHTVQDQVPYQTVLEEPMLYQNAQPPNNNQYKKQDSKKSQSESDQMSHTVQNQVPYQTVLEEPMLYQNAQQPNNNQYKKQESKKSQSESDQMSHIVQVQVPYQTVLEEPMLYQNAQQPNINQYKKQVISEESKKPMVVTSATEPGIRAVIFKDNGKPELYSSILSNEELHAPRMIEKSQSESDQMSHTVQDQVPYQTVLEEPMLYQNAQQPNNNQYKKQDSKKSQSESDQMSHTVQVQVPYQTVLEEPMLYQNAQQPNINQYKKQDSKKSQSESDQMSHTVQVQVPYQTVLEEPMLYQNAQQPNINQYKKQDSKKSQSESDQMSHTVQDQVPYQTVLEEPMLYQNAQQPNINQYKKQQVISEESKKPVVVTPATEPGIRAVIFEDNGKPELYSLLLSNEELHAPRMIEKSQSESDQMSHTVQVQVPYQTVLEEPMLYQNAQQPNINQYKKQDSKKSQSESDQMSYTVQDQVPYQTVLEEPMLYQNAQQPNNNQYKKQDSKKSQSEPDQMSHTVQVQMPYQTVLEEPMLYQNAQQPNINQYEKQDSKKSQSESDQVSHTVQVQVPYQTVLEEPMLYQNAQQPNINQYKKQQVISEKSKKPVVVTPATEPGIRAVIFKDNGKPELYSSILSNEELHAPRMIEKSQSESDQMSHTVQVQVPYQTVLEEPMLYQNAQQPNINQYKKQASKKSQSESDQMSYTVQDQVPYQTVLEEPMLYQNSQQPNNNQYKKQDSKKSQSESDQMSHTVQVQVPYQTVLEEPMLYQNAEQPNINQYEKQDSKKSQSESDQMSHTVQVQVPYQTVLEETMLYQNAQQPNINQYKKQDSKKSQSESDQMSHAVQDQVPYQTVLEEPMLYQNAQQPNINQYKKQQVISKKSKKPVVVTPATEPGIRAVIFKDNGKPELYSSILSNEELHAPRMIEKSQSESDQMSHTVQVQVPYQTVLEEPMLYQNAQQPNINQYKKQDSKKSQSESDQMSYTVQDQVPYQTVLEEPMLYQNDQQPNNNQYKNQDSKKSQSESDQMSYKVQDQVPYQTVLEEPMLYQNAQEPNINQYKKQDSKKSQSESDEMSYSESIIEKPFKADRTSISMEPVISGGEIISNISDNLSFKDSTSARIRKSFTGSGDSLLGLLQRVAYSADKITDIISRLSSSASKKIIFELLEQVSKSSVNKISEKTGEEKKSKITGKDLTVIKNTETTKKYKDSADIINTKIETIASAKELKDSTISVYNEGESLKESVTKANEKNSIVATKSGESEEIESEESDESVLMEPIIEPSPKKKKKGFSTNEHVLMALTIEPFPKKKICACSTASQTYQKKTDSYRLKSNRPESKSQSIQSRPERSQGFGSQPRSQGLLCQPRLQGSQSQPRSQDSKSQSQPRSQGSQSQPRSQGSQSQPRSQGSQSQPRSQGSQSQPRSQGSQSQQSSQGSQSPPKSQGFQSKLQTKLEGTIRGCVYPGGNLSVPPPLDTPQTKSKEAISCNTCPVGILPVDLYSQPQASQQIICLYPMYQNQPQERPQQCVPPNLFPGGPGPSQMMQPQIMQPQMMQPQMMPSPPQPMPCLCQPYIPCPTYPCGPSSYGFGYGTPAPYGAQQYPSMPYVQQPCQQCQAQNQAPYQTVQNQGPYQTVQNQIPYQTVQNRVPYQTVQNQIPYQTVQVQVPYQTVLEEPMPYQNAQQPNINQYKKQDSKNKCAPTCTVCQSPPPPPRNLCEMYSCDAYTKEEAGGDTSVAEATRQYTSGVEAVKQEAVKEEAAEEETSEVESAEEYTSAVEAVSSSVVEAAEEDTSKVEAAEEDTSEAEATEEDTSEAEAEKEDTSGAEAAEEYTSKVEAAEEDTSGAEVAEEDTSEAEAEKEDTSEVKAAEEDTSKVEEAEDTLGVEAAEEDTSGAEAAEEDTLVIEAAGEDTSGVEAEEKETSEVEAAEEDTSGAEAAEEDTLVVEAAGEDTSGVEAEEKVTSEVEAAEEDTSGAMATEKDTLVVEAAGEDTSGVEAAEKETSGVEAAKEDTSGAEATEDDTLVVEAAGEDTSGVEAAGEDTSGVEAAGEDTSGVEAAETETSEVEAAEEDTSGAGAAEEDTLVVEAAVEDTSGVEAAEKDTSGAEAAEEDTLVVEAAGEDTSGVEAAEKETSEVEAAEEDTSGADAAEEDTLVVEAAGEDTLVVEAVGEDTSGVEAAEKETSEVEAAEEDTSGAEAAEEDTLVVEAAGEDTSGVEAAEKETSGVEAAEEDTSGVEAAGDDTSGVEAAGDDTAEEYTLAVEAVSSSVVEAAEEDTSGVKAAEEDTSGVEAAGDDTAEEYTSAVEAVSSSVVEAAEEDKSGVEAAEEDTSGVEVAGDDTSVVEATEDASVVEAAGEDASVVEAAEEDTSVVEAAVVEAAVVEAEGEVTSVVEAAVEVTSVVEAAGEVTSVVEAAVEVTSVVEAAGEVTSVVEAAGEVISVVESAGEVTSVVEAAGEITSVVKAAVEVTSVVEAAGEVTSVVEAAREVTSVVEAAGEVTSIVEAAGEITDEKTSGDYEAGDAFESTTGTLSVSLEVSVDESVSVKSESKCPSEILEKSFESEHISEYVASVAESSENSIASAGDAVQYTATDEHALEKESTIVSSMGSIKSTPVSSGSRIPIAISPTRSSISKRDEPNIPGSGKSSPKSEKDAPSGITSAISEKAALGKSSPKKDSSSTTYRKSSTTITISPTRSSISKRNEPNIPGSGKYSPKSEKDAPSGITTPKSEKAALGKSSPKKKSSSGRLSTTYRKSSTSITISPTRSPISKRDEPNIPGSGKYSPKSEKDAPSGITTPKSEKAALGKSSPKKDSSSGRLSTTYRKSSTSITISPTRSPISKRDEPNIPGSGKYSPKSEKDAPSGITSPKSEKAALGKSSPKKDSSSGRLSSTYRKSNTSIPISPTRSPISKRDEPNIPGSGKCSPKSEKDAPSGITSPKPEKAALGISSPKKDSSSGRLSTTYRNSNTSSGKVSNKKSPSVLSQGSRGSRGAKISFHIKDCSCKVCKCNPCKDPKIPPMKGPDYSLSIGGGCLTCRCEVCRCKNCIDPRRKNMDNNKAPHFTCLPCDCIKCECAPCNDPKILDTKGKISSKSYECSNIVPATTLDTNNEATAVTFTVTSGEVPAAPNVNETCTAPSDPNAALDVTFAVTSGEVPAASNVNETCTAPSDPNAALAVTSAVTSGEIPAASNVNETCTTPSDPNAALAVTSGEVPAALNVNETYTASSDPNAALAVTSAVTSGEVPAALNVNETYTASSDPNAALPVTSAVTTGEVPAASNVNETYTASSDPNAALAVTSAVTSGEVPAALNVNETYTASSDPNAALAVTSAVTSGEVPAALNVNETYTASSDPNAALAVTSAVTSGEVPAALNVNETYTASSDPNAALPVTYAVTTGEVPAASNVNETYTASSDPNAALAVKFAVTTGEIPAASNVNTAPSDPNAALAASTPMNTTVILEPRATYESSSVFSGTTNSGGSSVPTDLSPTQMTIDGKVSPSTGLPCDCEECECVHCKDPKISNNPPDLGNSTEYDSTAADTSLCPCESNAQQEPAQFANVTYDVCSGSSVPTTSTPVFAPTATSTPARTCPYAQSVQVGVRKVDILYPRSATRSRTVNVCPSAHPVDCKCPQCICNPCSEPQKPSSNVTFKRQQEPAQFANVTYDLCSGSSVPTTNTPVIAPTATSTPVFAPTATSPPVFAPTATSPPVFAPTATSPPARTCPYTQSVQVDGRSVDIHYPRSATSSRTVNVCPSAHPVDCKCPQCICNPCSEPQKPSSNVTFKRRQEPAQFANVTYDVCSGSSVPTTNTPVIAPTATSTPVFAPTATSTPVFAPTATSPPAGTCPYTQSVQVDGRTVDIHYPRSATSSRTVNVCPSAHPVDCKCPQCICNPCSEPQKPSSNVTFKRRQEPAQFANVTYDVCSGSSVPTTNTPVIAPTATSTPVFAPTATSPSAGTCPYTQSVQVDGRTVDIHYPRSATSSRTVNVCPSAHPVDCKCPQCICNPCSEPQKPSSNVTFKRRQEPAQFANVTYDVCSGSSVPTTNTPVIAPTATSTPVFAPTATSTPVFAPTATSPPAGTCPYTQSVQVDGRTVDIHYPRSATSSRTVNVCPSAHPVDCKCPQCICNPCSEPQKPSSNVTFKRRQEPAQFANVTYDVCSGSSVPTTNTPVIAPTATSTPVFAPTATSTPVFAPTATSPPAGTCPYTQSVQVDGRTVDIHYPRSATSSRTVNVCPSAHPVDCKCPQCICNPCSEPQKPSSNVTFKRRQEPAQFANVTYDVCSGSSVPTTNTPVIAPTATSTPVFAPTATSPPAGTCPYTQSVQVDGRTVDIHYPRSATSSRTVNVCPSAHPVDCKCPQCICNPCSEPQKPSSNVTFKRRQEPAQFANVTYDVCSGSSVPTTNTPVIAPTATSTPVFAPTATSPPAGTCPYTQSVQVDGRTVDIHYPRSATSSRTVNVCPSAHPVDCKCPQCICNPCSEPQKPSSNVTFKRRQEPAQFANVTYDVCSGSSVPTTNTPVIAPTATSTPVFAPTATSPPAGTCPYTQSVQVGVRKVDILYPRSATSSRTVNVCPSAHPVDCKCPQCICNPCSEPQKPSSNVTFKRRQEPAQFGNVTYDVCSGSSVPTTNTPVIAPTATSTPVFAPTATNTPARTCPYTQAVQVDGRKVDILYPRSATSSRTVNVCPSAHPVDCKCPQCICNPCSEPQKPSSNVTFKRQQEPAQFGNVTYDVCSGSSVPTTSTPVFAPTATNTPAGTCPYTQSVQVDGRKVDILYPRSATSSRTVNVCPSAHPVDCKCPQCICNPCSEPQKPSSNVTFKRQQEPAQFANVTYDVCSGSSVPTTNTPVIAPTATSTPVFAPTATSPPAGTCPYTQSVQVGVRKVDILYPRSATSSRTVNVCPSAHPVECDCPQCICNPCSEPQKPSSNVTFKRQQEPAQFANVTYDVCSGSSVPTTSTPVFAPTATNTPAGTCPYAQSVQVGVRKVDILYPRSATSSRTVNVCPSAHPVECDCPQCICNPCSEPQKPSSNITFKRQQEPAQFANVTYDVCSGSSVPTTSTPVFAPTATNTPAGTCPYAQSVQVGVRKVDILYPRSATSSRTVNVCPSAHPVECDCPQCICNPCSEPQKPSSNVTFKRQQEPAQFGNVTYDVCSGSSVPTTSTPVFAPTATNTPAVTCPYTQSVQVGVRKVDILYPRSATSSRTVNVCPSAHPVECDCPQCICNPCSEPQKPSSNAIINRQQYVEPVQLANVTYDIRSGKSTPTSSKGATTANNNTGLNDDFCTCEQSTTINRQQYVEPVQLANVTNDIRSGKSTPTSSKDATTASNNTSLNDDFCTCEQSTNISPVLEELASVTYIKKHDGLAASTTSSNDDPCCCEPSVQPTTRVPTAQSTTNGELCTCGSGHSTTNVPRSTVSPKSVKVCTKKSPTSTSHKLVKHSSLCDCDECKCKPCAPPDFGSSKLPPSKLGPTLFKPTISEGQKAPVRAVAMTGTEDLRNLDTETIKRRLIEMENEARGRTNEIAQIRKFMSGLQSQCTCGQISPMTAESRSFEQTISGLQCAIAFLQEKCRKKDRMITTFTEELRQRTDSGVFDSVMHKIAAEKDTRPNPDYDRIGAANRLPTPGDMKSRQVMRTPAEKPCAPVRPVKDDASQCSPQAPKSVDPSPLAVTEVRRIAPDSLLLKWERPASQNIRGYEVEVNGEVKSRVHSAGRNATVLNGLVINGTMNLAVIAISLDGDRCSPAAKAVYQAQESSSTNNVTEGQCVC